MSTPTPDSSRLQTRAKNVNQHPGDAIPKRKRRTKAEMAQAREAEKLQSEAKKKEKEENLQAVAKVENKIAAKDKQAAAGVAHQKVKATVQPSREKKDQGQANKVSIKPSTYDPRSLQIG